MWKLKPFFKQQNTLKQFFAFKMTYSYCFSSGGNLHFLKKCFWYWLQSSLLYFSLKKGLCLFNILFGYFSIYICVSNIFYSFQWQSPLCYLWTVWPDRAILKVLGDKFSHKFALNAWWFLGHLQVKVANYWITYKHLNNFLFQHLITLFVNKILRIR